MLDAPITVQDDCASECAQGQYRRCLEKALIWLREFSGSSGNFIYLPEGMLEMVLNDVVAKVKRNFSSLKSAGSVNDVPFLTTEKNTTNGLSASSKIAYNGFPDGQVEEYRGSFHTNTTATAVPTATLLGDDRTFSIIKRSRSSSHLEHVFKKRRRADDNGGNKMNETLIAEEITHADGTYSASASKHSRPNAMHRKKTISASQAFTDKLERLLCGDDTIELKIGNTSLSRHLRDVPEPRALNQNTK